ncbi:type IV secretory pathway TrbF-like protein [Deinobacterium chartae]|uniref:Type IV secretory pathway TrbF-like protein n=1 Tax=Deinobacterium chartae TaxID=521158 RepID=A0A841HYW3_9DEIO|nr:hypothetical protein [Deinobacterium chartae]MBB6097092.1 type IV secretory pathway TrbF-like protein [Deinobacterium chartae]
MSEHPDRWDELFARAASLGPHDHAAAERMVQAFRVRRQRAHQLRLWLAGGLAGAALLGGGLMWQQAQGPLAPSVAYDLYQQTSGW